MPMMMFRIRASFGIAIGAMICATFGVLIQTIIGEINGMATKLIPIFLLFLSNTPLVAMPSALGLQLVNNMKNKEIEDWQKVSTREKIVTWLVAIVGTVLWFTIILLMLSAGSRSL